MKGAVLAAGGGRKGGAALTGRAMALCCCCPAEVAAECSFAGPWQNRDRRGGARLARVFLNRVRRLHTYGPGEGVEKVIVIHLKGLKHLRIKAKKSLN